MNLFIIVNILLIWDFVHDKNDIVFPAKAGIHFWCRMMALRTWIPAFAGTTNFKNFVFCHVQRIWDLKRLKS